MKRIPHRSLLEDGAALGTAEALLAIAKQHFSTAFPNARREGCDTDEMATLIGSRKLPQGKMLDHLLSCSHCFLQYRNMRRAFLEVIAAEDKCRETIICMSFLKESGSSLPPVH
jgi:hypothetical protein